MVVVDVRRLITDGARAVRLVRAFVHSYDRPCNNRFERRLAIPPGVLAKMTQKTKRKKTNKKKKGQAKSASVTKGPGPSTRSNDNSHAVVVDQLEALEEHLSPLEIFCYRRTARARWMASKVQRQRSNAFQRNRATVSGGTTTDTSTVRTAAGLCLCCAVGLRFVATVIFTGWLCPARRPNVGDTRKSTPEPSNRPVVGALHRPTRCQLYRRRCFRPQHAPDSVAQRLGYPRQRRPRVSRSFLLW